MKRYKVTHIMNKKQLGIILVAGLFCGTANAVVDLNADKPATVMIANENEIDKTTVMGDIYDVTGKVGFFVPAGTTYYARMELGGGAKFGSDNADLASSSGFSGFGGTVGHAAGGKDSDFLILSLTGSSDNVDWTLDADYILASKATVSFSYRLYETASTAIAGGSNGALGDAQTADLIKFANATDLAGAPSASSKIDVGTSSVKFENETSTTHIMKVSISNTSGDQVTAAGDNNVLADASVTMEMVVDKVTLTATGDFSAVAAATKGKTAGKVWLDMDDKCTPTIVAGEVIDPNATPKVTADADLGNVPTGATHNLGEAIINDAELEAVVTLTNTDNTDSVGDANYFGDIKDAYLCMETNGESEIPEGEYFGKLSMTTIDGYDDIAVESFDGSTLEKNSDSADLNFLLTPSEGGGHFTNYVRLTNTSNVQSSNLRVTLINDAGDEVTFPLSDVAGISSDGLAPRASTSLININALYAVAQEVDRGDDGMFTVEGEGMGNKLRAKFEGSFIEGTLEAQALSLSRDNNVFFTF